MSIYRIYKNYRYHRNYSIYKESQLIEHLERIALRLQPLYGARKGIENLVVALERIVERDDGAGTCVAAHIEQHVATIETGGIVARNEVPHHNAVAAALDEHIMIVEHPPVGRTEKVGLENDIRLIDIGNEALRRMAHTAPMVEGVVANAVTAILYHLKNLGIFARIFAHHEEGGFHAVFIKHIEYPRCYFGDGTIVEGEIDALFLVLHPPKRTRIKPT